MGEEVRIREYLIKYYKLVPEELPSPEVIEAKELLIPARFDLGAKLYYIHAAVTGKNRKLALKLYTEHIKAFQDGIVVETGQRSKKGMKCYIDSFDRLIRCFRRGKFDREKEWIPVDGSGQCLDGAHRVACAIYFHEKIKVLRLDKVKGYAYDYRYFRKRALALGYQKIMADTFFRFSGNYTVCSEKTMPREKILFCGGGCFDPVKKSYMLVSGVQRKEDIQLVGKLLMVAEMENREEIILSLQEQMTLRGIRFFRNKYTLSVIMLKKLLRRPL